MVGPNPRATVQNILENNYAIANSDSRRVVFQDPTIRGTDNLKDKDLIKVYEINRTSPQIGITHQFYDRLDTVQVDVMSVFGVENGGPTSVTGEEHIHKMAEEARRVLLLRRDSTSLASDTLPSTADPTYKKLDVLSSENFSDDQRRVWRIVITVELRLWWEALPGV